MSDGKVGGTVTSIDPPMVRVDGASTSVPVRIASGHARVGGRVLLERIGPSLFIVGSLDTDLAWRHVGSGAGDTPYATGWSVWGDPSYLPVRFKRTADGTVFMRGLALYSAVANAGDLIFTLPVGYRPAGSIILLEGWNASGASKRWQVHPDGSVVYSLPVNGGWHSLAASWLAEQ